jgi:DNA polymerase-3 subunit alpha
MAKSFVHLHTHSEYSMLDGASRISELVAAASFDGQRGLGITDHGNMHGAIDFYTASRNAGINPIIGSEVYMAAESRLTRPLRTKRSGGVGGDPDEDSGSKLYYHLTLLAVDTGGYHNLMRLSSEAFLSGFAYKPRVDWELLERYHQGLIATSGCLGGLVLQALLADDKQLALEIASRLRDIFGPENFYVELQDHGLSEQRRTNPELISISKKLGSPLVATNDSHYTTRGDAVTHDALLCIQTNARISDTQRFRFSGQEYYLKSAAEMRVLFSEVPEACDSTLAICERADIHIDFGHPLLPEFEIPEQFSGSCYQERADSYLKNLTYEGAGARWGSGLSNLATERLDHELAVISEMGFSAYFLIVWDLISYARRRGIRVGPGRGSAGGSCVAFCLGIVDIDPLAYNLLFERFLNSGRAQMPDIDMDFDERYRGEMIAYASERYGVEHVAQIITFSTIGARAGVRDAARVLGLPYSVGDRISKAMPRLGMGRSVPLAACLTHVAGFEDAWRGGGGLRELYEDDPDCNAAIEVAKGLEGLVRQDGIHAAAVVITKGVLTDYLPVLRKPDPDGGLGPVVTQYEMHAVEQLGLLKMDFLGLRNLSVISRAVALIGRSTGNPCDIDHVSLDDDATYALLCSGDTIGVFQLESGPMRALMRALEPTCFDDVAALIALYRPGPMAANMHYDYADRKNGRREVTYIHPDLKEILSDSYGLMIYQESLMLVAAKFAGYSLAQADNLRRATAKKDRALLAGERSSFVAGCVANGYSHELGQQLFDIIEPFADYAFNKSHSYGYGMIAYQTAWLKANHPVEYFCALLSSVRGDGGRTTLYLGECARLGIRVLIPDVNRSETEFTPGGDRSPLVDILFGLSSIKGVGVEVAMAIIDERDRGGKFADFYDFARRVGAIVVHKRPLEALIRSGAFDGLGCSRQGLLTAYPRIVKAAQTAGRKAAVGVVSLFGPEMEAATFDARIPTLEFPVDTLLAYEKELCGLYLSGHPLDGYEVKLSGLITNSVADVSGIGVDEPLGDPWVTVGGVVTALVKRTTKRGDRMATFTLEDLTGAVEVTVFPKTFVRFGHLLLSDAVVIVKGRIDLQGDEVGVIGTEIDLLS